MLCLRLQPTLGSRRACPPACPALPSATSPLTKNTWPKHAQASTNQNRKPRAPLRSTASSSGPQSLIQEEPFNEDLVNTVTLTGYLDTDLDQGYDEMTDSPVYWCRLRLPKRVKGQQPDEVLWTNDMFYLHLSVRLGAKVQSEMVRGTRVCVSGAVSFIKFDDPESGNTVQQFLITVSEVAKVNKNPSQEAEAGLKYTTKSTPYAKKPWVK